MHTTLVVHSAKTPHLGSWGLTPEGRVDREGVPRVSLTTARESAPRLPQAMLLHREGQEGDSLMETSAKDIQTLLFYFRGPRQPSDW